MIVIGVDADKDGFPVLRAEGMTITSGMEDTVWQKLGDSIDPPVTPEFGLAQDAGKGFIILRVRESEIAPHYILQTNRIYIRSGAVNAPAKAEEAALSRIEWMLNRRQKAEGFRELLNTRMNAHLENVATMRGVRLIFPMLKLWFVPRFPHDRLATLEQLEPLVPNIRVSNPKLKTEFPRTIRSWSLGQDCTNARVETLPDGEKYIEQFELGTYGTMFHAVRFVTPGVLLKATQTPHAVSMNLIARFIDLFAASAAKLYETLGFHGLVEGYVRLENVLGATVIPLFRDDGMFYPRADEMKRPELDRSLDWRLSVTMAQLADGDARRGIVQGLIRDIGWSLGFKFTDTEITAHLL